PALEGARDEARLPGLRGVHGRAVTRPRRSGGGEVRRGLRHDAPPAPRRPHRGLQRVRALMRIGITCYPTYGGSGVVATELGHELARRGHHVHFITYALPSRLDVFAERVAYHEVTVPSYPLFQYAPYDLALATRMADVAVHEGLDLIHVHYALPHAISAHLAREMLAPHPLAVVTTLHGTDITIVGQDRSYLPVTRFGIERSDGVTAVSEYLKRVTLEVFQPKKEIDVVPNFVDAERWRPGRRCGLSSRLSANGRKVLMHVSN